MPKHLTNKLIRMKKYNFYAGPAILTDDVIKKTAEAVLNFEGTGLSILEISHRSNEFDAVMIEAQTLVKELLNLPDNYKVLFLGGGASTQFFHVPFNLMKSKAGYLNTGLWASKAMKEAKNYGTVVEVASSKDKNYSYLPTGYTIPTDIDYLHITTNNTIYGTQLKKDLNSPVKIVADMSSDIFSHPIDVTKYSLIYAGAQKNIGPAGVTLVIVDENALGKVDRALPSMVDYRTHIENDSMYNTPPCLPVYTSMLTLRWYKQLGGLKVLQQMNEAKAKVLYDEIDRNRLFKCPVPNAEDRSLMNVCFVMNEQNMEFEKEFNAFAEQRYCLGLKGHRSVGGFRASIYNAMPKEGVLALVDVMKEFEKMKLA